MKPKKIIILLFLILVFFLVLAISYYQWSHLSVLDPRAAACEKKGGDIMLSSSSEAICNIKTKDKNKACTDSSQCEGYCRAPFKAKAGQSVQGFCSEYREKSTDWQEVIGGVAGELILIN